MKNLFRKIRVYFFGLCKVKGCIFKMQKGWAMNDKFDIDNRDPMKNCFRDRNGNYMTKEWIYYECIRCGVIKEKY